MKQIYPNIQKVKNSVSVVALSIFFSLTLAAYTNAATGKLQGSVKDAETGDPLIGTTIIVEGTTTGTSADYDGNYTLKLDPGTYTIKVSYIGYKSQTAQVQIISGQITIQDFKLSYEVMEGMEVTVTAQAAGQFSAINQQLASSSIKNVVSSDRIQELPDRNAAESLGRLPGVSILRSGGEANQIAIRGLSPKFNSISIEGVQMTATSDANRSVSLAGISSNSLDGIEVTKAITPDMDANTLGGAVNLRMKEAPEEFTLNMLAQGGYNAHDNLFDEYKFVISTGNRFFNKKLGVFATANIEQVNRGNDILKMKWLRLVNQPVPLAGNGLILSDKKAKRKRVGASLVLDYRLPFGSFKFNNYFNRLNNRSTNRVATYDGVSGDNLTYSITDNPSNMTDQYINSFMGEFDIMGANLDFTLSHAYSQKNNPNAAEWILVQRGAVKNYDLIYVDNFTLPDSTVYDTISEVTRSYRDVTGFQERDFGVAINLKIPFNLGDIASGHIKLGGKYKKKRKSQDISSLFINASRAFRGGYRDAIATASDDYTHYGGKLFLNESGMDNDFTVPDFLNGEFDYPPVPDIEKLREMYTLTENYVNALPPEDIYSHGWWINTSGSVLKDFSGTEELYAGYLLAELWFLNKKLMLLGGVRFENMNREYTGYRFLDTGDDNIDPGKIPQKTDGASNHHFFPMVHLRYKPKDWFDIRLARTKTLTRPDYFDITPWYHEIADGNEGKGGNPYLKPATAINYDLQLSFYKNKLGLLTLGGFHKEISDMIWNSSSYIQDPAEYGLPETFVDYNWTTKINNKHKAYVTGLEFDWQTNFWYLPRPFNGLVTGINYTHIVSTTTYPAPKYHSVQISQVEWEFWYDSTTVKAGLEDQPSDIFNVFVGYDYKGFSARLSFYLQTKTLVNKNVQYVEMNNYTETYSRFDLSLKQDLPWYNLQLFFDISNITDTPDKRYQYNHKYPTRWEYYGRSLSLGLRYKL